MKVLITGKNGQVGSCLVSQLSNMTEINFLALSREELDITNAEQVSKIVNEYKPSVIINAAAYTAVDKAESEVELANAINNLGPKNLAKAAAQVNAAIIHISTDYVFAGNKEGLYTETDEVNPQGVYGQTKLAGEQSVAQECDTHIILRTAWVFSEFGNNFVKTMLRLAQTRDTLGVVGDQFGGPTYAGDIAKAIVSIAQQLQQGSTKFGVYNYSGYPHVSWQEFASEIFEKALAKNLIQSPITVNSILTADYPTPAKRPANSKLDCSKITTDFSIQPSDWKAALNTIQQYK
ncbi:dTDP-4-dehydrorhamnose reductase [Pseudoalteromonas sp. SR43-6]|uniref:dTDP-4-dehydrorhamnose reductase n=1 Tax=unclassified Pseudoalteromonas TaxID=194690 RepID=UPI0015FC1F48|nr:MULTISPECIES: dTDP-4-dehydrorhamnose reductase [unclassified Pseudoalteromonas]MBB1290152.1 dTDP-4-dehydrorhamnose reductase [Pseudoalteromonas sp. SR41-5]MBB1373801.1 dTDP-4-dehydrorhamnose reductase [Pseudoalteromonas sp. SR43-6]MBB1412852.1 dTDP-4-dehydrorhamnose reductase [Pseudoalteromonas sp. SG43-8]